MVIHPSIVFINDRSRSDMNGWVYVILWVNYRGTSNVEIHVGFVTFLTHPIVAHIKYKAWRLKALSEICPFMH